MSNRRLLIAMAHPDDESFGLGGLIARYVAEGVDVYLICSTDGSAGTVLPEYLEGYQSISELRLAELDCAAEILGFKKVFNLGYKDSGMMNSETSKDPDCSWQAPREKMARQVVEIIREVQPQVVITFNRYGGYGHPDHIAIQRATVDAFQLAGDPDYVTGDLPPYAPQKLYYTAMPTRRLRYGILMMRLRGQNPRKLGRNNDIDLVAILDHVEPVHTQVDIGAYLEIWDRASLCHKSQLAGGFLNRPPMWYRRRFGNKQTFTRVFPTPRRNRVDEYDLFEGVQLGEAVEVG